MRVVAPDTNGVKSVGFTADVEKGHCSNHTYHSSGCPDCWTSALFTSVASLCGKVIPYQLGALRKRTAKVENNGQDPKLQLIQQQLSRVFAIFFAGAKHDAAKAAVKKVKQLTKAEVSTDEEIALAAFLAIEWAKLYDAVKIDLFGAVQAGIDNALTQESYAIGTRKEMLKYADAYASARAAEMIGKKVVNDKLVDNSNAVFVISKTTEDDLNDIVDRAMKSDLTMEQLEQRIVSAGTFSDMRAKLIAKNEVALAQVKGALVVWKHIGVKQVNVVLSNRHVVPDQCDKHSAGSPYDIDKVPMIPSHPNCECSLEVVE